MRKIKEKYFRYHELPDIVNILFLLFLTAVNIVFNQVLPYWFTFSLINISLVIIITLIVSKYESKSPAEKEELKNKFSLLKLLRYWYPLLLVLYVFKQVYLLVHPINPNDIDTSLIQIDLWMFGVNPTEWAYRFANPIVTEFLQIIYSLYYIIITVYGIEIYTKKRYSDFNYSVFVLFLGFYIAYILYMIFPAVGPRFYLHDFFSISNELPGIFITEPFRVILNWGESIPAGVPNPQDYVQRDAMPSLHAEIVILLAYLSKKLKLKSFYFYLPYCILMMIATIYLRYHYVVDLIGGAIAALIAILVGKYFYQINNGFASIKNTENAVPNI